MLSTDEKQYYQEVLQINTYGLSNIIRNITKKKNKGFYEIDRNDLEEYVDSQNAENAFWDEIFKICEENNYSGNKKFILNTISHMKDKRCHTDDKIQNVKNYFKIMQYNQYLKDNKLSELICQCCGKSFLDKPNTKYCQECLIEAECCICGKKLGRLKPKNEDKHYYCNSCKGKKSVESNKKSGNCTKCGIYNIIRDQNGRGKDGIENGGCNCSQDFYNKHNSSPKMRYQGKKALQDFYKTEKGQQFIIEHNQSEVMREQARKAGKLYGVKNLKITPTFNKNGEYFDSRLNKFVNWNDYKNKFKIQNVDFELPKDFKIISTFRTQESQDWTSAKTAFEQSLIDLNINWFVYIKYYVNNENQILPLVVGKSGSLNVNKNGSDVNFSENVNDGPARRFLNENRYSWCKTQISILKCISEQEALNIEKEIHDKYSLFYS